MNKSSFQQNLHKLAPVLKELHKRYAETTPKQVQLIDFFLLAVLLTGIAQFVYCFIAGSFPYNAFLSGFIAAVGTFVLTGAFFVLFCFVFVFVAVVVFFIV